MNVWVPQSAEAIAESRKLLHVTKNVMSSAKNKINMGLVYDAITAAFVLTREEIIDEGLYLELKEIINNTDDLKSLDQRLLKHKVPPRSGRGTFSMVFPKDFNYFKKNLIILNGILISGIITGEHIGPSSESIVEAIYMKYGAKRYAEFLTNTSYMILKYITERGHTVGIADCMSIDSEKRKKELEENEKAFEVIQAKIDALGPIPDNDDVSLQLYENNIKNIIMSSAEMGFSLIKENISDINNNIGVMLAKLGGGAKGKMLNIQQIRGRLGQQYRKGERLPLSCGNRILPGFDENDPDIRARGYIKSNFMRGLSPEEHFLHMMAAREGLIDTAVNVSIMGDSHRRVIKALENIFVDENGAVVNSSKANFQLLSGGDGFDPARLTTVKRIGSNSDPVASFIDVQEVVKDLNMESGWVSKKTFKAASFNNYIIEIIYQWIENDEIVPAKIDISSILYNYFGQDNFLQEVETVDDSLQKVKADEPARLRFYYKLSDNQQSDINKIKKQYKLESQYQLEVFKTMIGQDIIVNKGDPKIILRILSAKIV